LSENSGGQVIASVNHAIQHLGVGARDATLVNHLVGFTKEHSQIVNVVDLSALVRSGTSKGMQVTDLARATIQLFKQNGSLRETTKILHFLCGVVSPNFLGLTKRGIRVAICVNGYTLGQSEAILAALVEEAASFGLFSSQLGSLSLGLDRRDFSQGDLPDKFG
jgi:hypothetical protein